MLDRIIPPAGPPRVLAMAQLTNSVGDGAYYVCSALYFTRVVGLSPAQVGFGLTLGWAVGALAGVPLGHLADRRGPRGTAVLLAVATGIAVASYLFAGSFALFLVAACLYACCQCGLAAVRQALLAGLVREGRRTDAPSWMVAAPLLLNTVGVTLFQVRVARRVAGLPGASRAVRRAGVLLLASCAAFALSAAGASAWTAAAVLLAAAVLQVLGEMMLAAGAWEIGFGLAPEDRQGQYQGFFGTGTAVARMIGPLSLTTLVMGWGAVGWLLLGGLFVLAGSAMAPAVAWARRSRRGIEAPSAPSPVEPAPKAG